MKRIFISMTLILWAAYAHSAGPMDKIAPNSYVSEAIYKSSAMSGYTTPGSEVRISTTRAILYAIWVSSPGSPGGQLDLYNGNATTGTAALPGIKLVSTIDTTRAGFYPVNVFCSSGIMVNSTNSATVSANVAPTPITFFYQNQK